MKGTLIAVLATTVVLGGVAVHAQSMVEYSNLSTNAAKALKTPVASPRMVQQTTSGAPAAAPATTSQPPAVDPNAPQAVIWEAKDVPGKKEPVGPPPPPAVFVLANGDRLETNRYLVTVNSVRVEQGGVQRTIPLTDINVDATVAANHARGLNLKFPTDKTQIMLGF
jgi:hypothetical protein